MTNHGEDRITWFGQNLLAISVLLSSWTFLFGKIDQIQNKQASICNTLLGWPCFDHPSSTGQGNQYEELTSFTAFCCLILSLTALSCSSRRSSSNISESIEQSEDTLPVRLFRKDRTETTHKKKTNFCFATLNLKKISKVEKNVKSNFNALLMRCAYAQHRYNSLFQIAFTILSIYM